MRMNEYICIYNAYIYIYKLFIFIDIFILCVVKEVKHGTCANPSLYHRLSDVFPTGACRCTRRCANRSNNARAQSAYCLRSRGTSTYRLVTMVGKCPN